MSQNETKKRKKSVNATYFISQQQREFILLHLVHVVKGTIPTTPNFATKPPIWGSNFYCLFVQCKCKRNTPFQPIFSSPMDIFCKPLWCLPYEQLFYVQYQSQWSHTYSFFGFRVFLPWHCKGQVRLKKRMNFWKNSKCPLTPPPILKLCCNFFFGKRPK